jgi:hypothetical protein
VRVDIEVEVAGQKITVVNIFDRDKGWLKTGNDTKEMDKDQINEAREKGHAAWVASLVPLKDKGYSLSLVGEDKVGDKPVTTIRVSHKDRRDVTLYFDQKSHMLLKSESRVKDDATGQEVTEETLYKDYNDKGLKQPKKLTINRDGKLFIEAESVDYKPGQDIDDSTFGKP